MLTDILIVLIVLALVGVSVWYIRKEKKQGKCVGCPHAKECAAKRAGKGCDSQKQ